MRDDLRGHGLPALLAELASQGISEPQLQAAAGLSDRWEPDYHARIAVFRAAQALAEDPETALRAGSRQTPDSFGAYGYAISSSATMRDAFRVGQQFFTLAGSVLRVSLVIEGTQGVWRSVEPESLGPVLPFVAEFWRSSQTTLLSQVLGRPFPSLSMTFPYPAPGWWRRYRDYMRCPVTFDSGIMEWRFDAAVFDEPCVQADPNMASVFEQYCDQFVRESHGRTPFQREVLRACVRQIALARSNAPSVAAALNISTRSLYRKLEAEGVSFQSLQDRLHRSIAAEYLQNTELSIQEIALRCGYSDTSNFRKAFRRWTDTTPSAFRDAQR